MAASCYRDTPRQLEACQRYMARFGLNDCEATRRELADVLALPPIKINIFSAYGRLGVLAEGAFPAVV